MNRFALFSVPVVGALAFAVACTDATSPGDARSALRPLGPSLVTGNLPPPPTRTVVLVTVASPEVFVGLFSGVYFANGGMIESVAAANELADAALAWNGTAWLRLDNTQTVSQPLPPFTPVSASANARFQITQGVSTSPNLSGRGTLVIFGVDGTRHTITIDRVTSFIPNPDCLTAAPTPCAVITFDASVDGQPGHHGTAQAFDREVCTFVVIPEEEEGGTFVCPFGGSGS